jgi:hypothetical protein
MMMLSLVNSFAHEPWYGKNPHVGDLMVFTVEKKTKLDSTKYRGNSTMCGLKDSTGKIVVDPIYDTIAYFGDDLYIATKNIHGYEGLLSYGGLLNKYGNFVLPVKYVKISDNYRNQFEYKIMDSLGIISHFNINTYEITNDYSPWFLKKIDDMYDGPDKYCLADNDCVCRTDTFRYIHICDNGKILAKKDTTTGFIDSNLVFKEEPFFRNLDIYESSGKTYEIKKQIGEDIYGEDIYKYGLLDSNYKLIIPCIYDSIQVDPDYVFLKKGNLWGEISMKNGDTIIPFKYNNLKPLYDIIRGEYSLGGSGVDFDYGMFGTYYYSAYGYGLGSVYAINATKRNRSYVVSPHNGRVITKGEIAENGFLKRRNKYGVLKDEKVIVPVKYSNISCLYSDQSNVYEVSNKKHKGLYNSQGKLILPVKYDELVLNYVDDSNKQNSHRWFRVQKGDNEGIFSFEGKWIVPLTYGVKDNTNDTLPHFLVYDKKDRYGAYSLEGKRLLPVKYKKIRYDKEKNILVGE